MNCNVLVISLMILASCNTNKTNKEKTSNLDTIKLKTDHIKINDTIAVKDSIVIPLKINN